MTTNNLTELWKKGELEIDNNYYLRFADGTEEIQLYIGGFLMRADNEVVEVLAEVPDYIEWKNYVNGYCEEHNYNLKLQEENQKLKELLKECREYVVNTPVYPQGDDNKQAEIHRLVDKINEALKWKTTKSFT